MIIESGVAGADRIKSRNDFNQFVKSYTRIISKFPGFVGVQPSGSYNSDPSKNEFGDIDLIVNIKSDKSKPEVKKELQKFFMQLPETIIVPFTSPKHLGVRTYNAGELVSVRYYDKTLDYSVQIDNIVALSQSESDFKKQFLNYTAENQGLLMGLVKVAAIESDPLFLFKKLGIKNVSPLGPHEEYEFNLSGSALELRKVTYKENSYKEVNREILWKSINFNDVAKLLYQYNINESFESLLKDAKEKLKNPRSKFRMTGIFNSLITVKSGEVGTKKGESKTIAQNKVKNTFESKFGSIYRALVLNEKLF